MKKHGFTLVELMVVIVIIGVLAAVVMPKFAKAVNVARVVYLLEDRGVGENFRDSRLAMEYFNENWASVDDTLLADAIQKIILPLTDADSLTYRADSLEIRADSLERIAVAKAQAVEKIKRAKKGYKDLTGDMFMIYTTDMITALKVIEKIKTDTGKDKFTIKEELSDGIIIKMEW